MKKFIAIFALLCAVMVSSTVSAETRIVPLCTQDVPTVTQKLQEIPGIKIWGLEKPDTSGSGYTGHFGDDDENRLIFLLGNDGLIKAVFIESQFGKDSPVLEQMLKLAYGTLIIAGVTPEDIATLMQEMIYDMKEVVSNNSDAKEYEKNFTVHSAQINGEIVMSLSMKDLTDDFGEFKIIMFAHE